MSNTFDKLSVLLDSFIEEVNSYLPEIETNLERLAQSPGDMDALEETYRRTHTIGGSASMMDFPGLAHVAHGMEDVLADAMDGLISVDEAALGLWHRSLGRLHQLLEGIRSGIDEDAVIAEDDADYARYRERGGTSLSHSQSAAVASSGYDGQPYAAPAFPAFESPLSRSSAVPSFDEVLASFRTPELQPGEEMGWPEDPMPSMHLPVMPALTPAIPPSAGSTPSSPLPTPSAMDTLMASTRSGFTSELPVFELPASTPESRTAQYPAVNPWLQIPSEHKNSSSPAVNAQAQFSAERTGQYPVLDVQTQSSAALTPVEQAQPPLPLAYTQMQQETQVIENQTSSLKHVLAQLRDAMSVIEAQRSEFKGFLNGSKDALDRMEEWAGRAMGLNLRNSPEQVRRYLPLSVMWVSNSKLKKVLDLLLQITGGVELTDEQLTLALGQLRSSLQTYGEEFQYRQEHSAQAQSQAPGWGPWEMQLAQDPLAMRERVTFERQGDLAALRVELEAQLREELRQEYAAQVVAPGVLEQQIREDVQREFEARLRMQKRAAGLPDVEDPREIEQRLRGELEIKVRQEVLEQLMQGDHPALSRSNKSAQDAAAADQAMAVGGPVVVQPAPLQSGIPLQSAVAFPPPPKSAPTPAIFTGDFGEEAAEVFRMEAEEHLQTISMQVAALEKNPDNLELIQGIRRATHTLKGAAGMMGFRAIADLSHISEDLLDAIVEGKMAISPAILGIILDTAEALDVLITGLGSNPAADEVTVRTLHARYSELLGEHSTTRDAYEEDIDTDSEDQVPHVSGVLTEGAANPALPNTPRGRGGLTVKVRLQRLDELVNLFGELLVNRSVLEERIQRLVRLVADVGVSSNRLRDVGQKLESRFEAATLPSGHAVQVMPGEGNQLPLTASSKAVKNGKTENMPAHLSEFDELELDRYTEFHQLARGLSEGISDMSTLSIEMDTLIRECEGVFSRENRLSTTFQDRLMKTRLVPLSQMTPRLYRAARAVAFKQGKEIDFVLDGEATEVDRTVFEEVGGPLLHLVRNAVNHAIERPEVRIQKGKPPTGQVKFSAGYEGNQIVISVRDDGTGLDRESVRQTAISRGLIRPEQQLTESDLVSLIFHPGFSTAEVLSEESGRGVGLDVVRDSVARLRGTIGVESTPGQGTTFTMIFPTSLAIQSAMMVRAGGQQFAIPTANVESIGRFDNFKRTTFSGQPAVLVRNETYPLHLLAQYLNLPNTGMVEEKAQILLVSASGHRVALVVDEIKGKSDIVMKNMGPHLRQVHGIAGATVLGNGLVVLVLELNDLISKGVFSTGSVISARRDAAKTPVATASTGQRVDLSGGRQSSAPARPVAPVAAATERGKHVLVVDDSPSVRRVVSNMLKQHGWEVQMARDGQEALEMISHETPAAVLLDIEMPRMDGYELISTVRAQEQYRTLPLIVLTSRAASKHQQRATSLGASAYVVKPYQDEELLKTISGLVYGTR